MGQYNNKEKIIVKISIIKKKCTSGTVPGKGKMLLIFLKRMRIFLIT